MKSILYFLEKESGFGEKEPLKEGNIQKDLLDVFFLRINRNNY